MRYSVLSCVTRQGTLFTVALAIVCSLYLYRLDQPLLWGDEADTGLAARSILQHSYPMAFDGRNLNVPENGAQLNAHLVWTRLGWLQFYVGAASLRLFGDSTSGLRLLFAILGAAAFLPMYAILRRQLPHPAFVTAVALGVPQIVLFQRNARYFSLLILLYAALMWHLSYPFRSRRVALATAALLFVAFFHTHSFAAACTAVSVWLFCVRGRPASLEHYSIAATIGCVSWVLWLVLLGSSLSPRPTLLGEFVTEPGRWLGTFREGLVATILDVDASGCIPILALAAILLYAMARRGSELRELRTDPIPAVVAMNLVVQTVAAAALFGYETGDKYSLMRYMPHLLLFAFLSTLVIGIKILGHRWMVGWVLLCGFTNLGTVSFWTGGRQVPVTWARQVYADLLSPPPDVRAGIFEFLQRQRSCDGGLLLSLPSWTQSTAVFYLGRWFVVQPTINDPSLALEEALTSHVPADVRHRLFAAPMWIVDFRGLAQRPGYARIAELSSSLTRPDDGTRPELGRHSFVQPDAASIVRVFKRQGTARECGVE